MSSAAATSMDPPSLAGPFAAAASKLGRAAIAVLLPIVRGLTDEQISWPESFLAEHVALVSGCIDPFELTLRIVLKSGVWIRTITSAELPAIADDAALYMPTAELASKLLELLPDAQVDGLLPDVVPSSRELPQAVAASVRPQKPAKAVEHSLLTPASRILAKACPTLVIPINRSCPTRLQFGVRTDDLAATLASLPLLLGLGAGAGASIVSAYTAAAPTLGMIPSGSAAAGSGSACRGLGGRDRRAVDSDSITSRGRG